MTASVSTDPVLNNLIDELTTRMQAGEVIDIEAVVAEHPDHAEPLRRLLPSLQVMADLGRSAHEPDSSVGANGDADVTALGDFRIIREVGRGGMGVVYEAEQMSLGRRVALKVLPYAGALDAKQLQRFKNEAKAAASLKHDHIVSVHAIGCERSVHFYAMEFVEGRTLAAIIDDFRFSIDDCKTKQPAKASFSSIENHQSKIENETVAALTTRKDKQHFRAIALLIADAADALEHAHSLGIVHRDVKPGNLLLDADGRVYVSDFGLARMASPGREAGELTMSGDVLGTLRYMAPEQAMAKHGLADHRVDVYGLGATLYELLTGKPAVKGNDKEEILKHLAFEEPIALRKLDKSIPAELETIALKCLAKDPAERYASAGELAADLRRWLEDKAIAAKPPGWRETAAKWAKRHRTAVLASAAILGLTVIALATFAVVLSNQRSETQDALGQAKANLTIADSQRRRAWQAVDDMYVQFAQKWLSDEPGMTDLQNEFLEKALRYYSDLASEEGDSPELVLQRAKAHGHIGGILAKRERHHEAEAAIRRAIAGLESAEIPDKSFELAGRYSALAYALSMNPGREDDAIAAAKHAIALFESLPNIEAAKAETRYARARTMTNLSLAFLNSGRHEECVRVCQQGAELCRGLVKEFPKKPEYLCVLGGLLGQQAVVVCALGDPHRGRELFVEAIRHEERAVELNPRRVETRWFLRNHYSAFAKACLVPLKRLPEAMDAACKSLAITEQLALDFPAVPHYRRCVAHSLSVLGELQAQRGEYVEAAEGFRRAVEIEDKLRAETPASSTDQTMAGTFRIQLAGALYQLGRNTEAVECYKTGFELDTGHIKGGYRCFAACAAARAGCGLGEGADKLDTQQRAEHRNQALEWLVADRMDLQESAVTPQGRRVLVGTLEKLRSIGDLAGVRDPQELAKLQESERAQWQKYWADVEELLNRTEKPAGNPDDR